MMPQLLILVVIPMSVTYKSRELSESIIKRYYRASCNAIMLVARGKKISCFCFKDSHERELKTKTVY